MFNVRSEFYLGGDWKGGKESMDVRNPWNDSVVGRVSLAGESDAEEAIKRAELSYRETKNLSSQERFEILSKILREVGERKEEFANLIAAEIGKPIRYSRVEVERAMLTLQIAAEESRRIGGEFVPIDLLPSTKGRFGVVRRFPIGVVLGITPFNFPLNLVVHKLAPAIAAGNTFILKPAPQAPLTSLLLAEIVESSGLPKGALSVLPCAISIAEKLVKDERIKMVSFTGSPVVGWSIKSEAGKKKVLLELGGNAGVIVDRSANVKDAVRKNALGAFVSGGQTCIKVQRVYIHEEIYGDYLDAFLRETASLQSGNPEDNDTIVGPLIDRAAVERVVAWIREAESHAAKVHCGGRSSGNLVEPTVLSGVRRSDKVFCNEVFGPVVTLHRFSSIEEAVRGINDSSFGLQAGIFSNDFDHILYAFNEIDAGAVIVNDNPTFRVDNMPYGGTKDSGFGREGVKYGIESMTEPKLLVVGPGVS